MCLAQPMVLAARPALQLERSDTFDFRLSILGRKGGREEGRKGGREGPVFFVYLTNLMAFLYHIV